MNNYKIKLLLHICCGPCLIYPQKRLKSIFPAFTGYFFNPNIYPKNEYELRLHQVENYSNSCNLFIIYDHNCNFEKFQETNTKFELKPEQRCKLCYKIRLARTAKYAQQNDFTHFSSTLLFSKYQRHELIIEVAKEQEKKYGINFYYEDFRCGWKEAVEYSKKIDMYRQKYCGCISSLNKKKSSLKVKHKR